ncbi:hypothetical protein, partial [Bacillus licheniformis]|uniref:hypothetical protein n=1 Tax=Bacillus licheniformis TaxID=1402 RepID=UPI0022800C88
NLKHLDRDRTCPWTKFAFEHVSAGKMCSQFFIPTLSLVMYDDANSQAAMQCCGFAMSEKRCHRFVVSNKTLYWK